MRQQASRQFCIWATPGPAPPPPAPCRVLLSYDNSLMTYGDVFLNKIYILPCIFLHYWSSVLSLSIIQHSFNFSKLGFFATHSLSDEFTFAIRCAKPKKKKTNGAVGKVFSWSDKFRSIFGEKKTGAWTARRKRCRKSVIYQNWSVANGFMSSLVVYFLARWTDKVHILEDSKLPLY